MSDPLGRRPFLSTVVSLAGIAAVGPGTAFAATRHERTTGPVSPAAGPGTWDLSWLDTLKGKHRQVFSAGVGGAVAMAIATNWLDAHQEVFGLKHPT